MGQTNGHNYMKPLLKRIEKSQIGVAPLGETNS
jgi:hypothetical protein